MFELTNNTTQPQAPAQEPAPAPTPDTVPEMPGPEDSFFGEFAQTAEPSAQPQQDGAGSFFGDAKPSEIQSAVEGWLSKAFGDVEQDRPSAPNWQKLKDTRAAELAAVFQTSAAKESAPALTPEQEEGLKEVDNLRAFHERVSPELATYKLAYDVVNYQTTPEYKQQVEEPLQRAEASLKRFLDEYGMKDTGDMKEVLSLRGEELDSFLEGKMSDRAQVILRSKLDAFFDARTVRESRIEEIRSGTEDGKKQLETALREKAAHVAKTDRDAMVKALSESAASLRYGNGMPGEGGHPFFGSREGVAATREVMTRFSEGEVSREDIAEALLKREAFEQLFDGYKKLRTQVLPLQKELAKLRRGVEPKASSAPTAGASGGAPRSARSGKFRLA